MCIKPALITDDLIQTNEFYSKCIGKKIYYYQAFHDVGPVENIYDFEDYAWVPKPKMNKFLSRDDFHFFMKFLKETNN